MSWFKGRKLHLFLIFLNISFILGVMRDCYGIQEYNFPLIVLWFIASIAIYWVYSVILHKPKYKFFFTLTLLIGGGIFLFYSKEFVNNFFIKGIVENVEAINDSLVRGRVTYFHQFKNIFMILVPLISIIAIYLEDKGLLPLITLINIGVMLFLWYLGYEPGVRNSMLKFALITIVTFGSNDNKNYLKKLNKTGIKLSLENNSVISQVIVIALILTSIIWFLPKDMEGIYGEDLKERINDKISINPNEEGGGSKGRVNSQYKLSSSGYNDSTTKLGGKIKLNSETVFKVDTENEKQSYYLKGAVKDNYSGEYWTITTKKYDTGSIDIKSEENLDRFIRAGADKKNIRVYPSKLNLYTMFVPNNTVEVTMENSKIFNNPEYGVYLNSTPVSRSYRVSFYDINFIEERISREAVQNTRGNYPSEFINKYTQLPYSITKRTVDLVKEITKGAKNDLEKVDKIRDYLSRNYPYSLEVSEVPEGVDFVDYFLFTEKKGYCVYFATAATIMSRIAGIPARYVEGFKMPPNPGPDGFYTVTNEDAHAWAEVCYDKGGNAWSIAEVSSTPTEQRQQNISNPSTGTNTEYENENINPNESNKENTEDISPDKQEEKLSFNYGEFAKIFFIALIILYVAGKNILRIINRTRAINSSSVIPIYKYIIKRLSYIGIKKSELETDKEFVENLPNEELKERLNPLVEALYKEYYGGYKVEGVQKNQLYKFIEVYVRNNKNILIYYIRKYIV